MHYKLKAHKLINDVKVNEYGLIRSYLVDVIGVENAFVDFPTREISSIGGGILLLIQLFWRKERAIEIFK